MRNFKIRTFIDRRMFLNLNVLKSNTGVCCFFFGIGRLQYHQYHLTNFLIVHIDHIMEIYWRKYHALYMHTKTHNAELLDAIRGGAVIWYAFCNFVGQSSLFVAQMIKTRKVGFLMGI